MLAAHSPHVKGSLFRGARLVLIDDSVAGK